MPSCQGITVADNSFTHNAFALKPSIFCSVEINQACVWCARLAN
jgi:hypothetical protein